MGLWKRLAEVHESNNAVTAWDCPFCNHLSYSEKAANRHIEKMHGGRS